MAKKYLLYIHDDRFDQEQEKSGLVNTLLSDWYGRIKSPENPYKAPVVSPRVIQLTQDAIKQIFPKAERLCKHGYSLQARMCKFGCR